MKKEVIDYKNNFNRIKYDQVILMIPKGSKEIWKEEATRRNTSLNNLIFKAVSAYINNEEKKG